MQILQKPWKFLILIIKISTKQVYLIIEIMQLSSLSIIFDFHKQIVNIWRIFIALILFLKMLNSFLGRFHGSSYHWFVRDIILNFLLTHLFLLYLVTKYIWFKILQYFILLNRIFQTRKFEIINQTFLHRLALQTYSEAFRRVKSTHQILNVKSVAETNITVTFLK